MRDTPVLIIIFNRPEKFQKLIESLKKIKPNQIYIFADGPRQDNNKDLELCKQTRKIISKINWSCKIKIFFLNKNIGVDKGVYSAINWLFNNEEFGIILEDDCIPTKDFFKFATLLKKKYSNNNNIGIISGNNFIKSNYIGSYFFSKWPHTWGWATWKRNWDKFNYEIPYWKKFRDSKKWKELNSDFAEYKTFTHLYNLLLDDKKKHLITWDFRWMLYLWYNNFVNIIPRYNLVKNIGFDKDATHTFVKDDRWILNTKILKTPLIHPKIINNDIFLDKKIFYTVYYKKSNIFFEYLKKIKFYFLSFINE
jgi:hypothetical protein